MDSADRPVVEALPGSERFSLSLAGRDSYSVFSS